MSFEAEPTGQKTMNANEIPSPRRSHEYAFLTFFASPFASSSSSSHLSKSGSDSDYCPLSPPPSPSPDFNSKLRLKKSEMESERLELCEIRKQEDNEELLSFALLGEA